MRRLAWFAVGMAAACAFCAYIFSDLLLLIPAGVILAAALLFLVLFRPQGRTQLFAILLLGLCVGLISFQLYGMAVLSGVSRQDGQVLSKRVIATDYSYPTAYGIAVDAKTEFDGRSHGVKVYLQGTQALAPGDLVEGSFQIRFTGPGGEKENVHYNSTGVHAVLYSRDAVQVTTGVEGGFFATELRRWLQGRLDAIFPADTASFARALLLGDTTSLTYETETDLTSSGIVHVVAVSGLHVSILLAVIYRLFGRNRLLTPIVGGAVLLLVCAVTGFPASVVRASLMNGLMLAALAFDREYDPPTGLAFAVVVMLGANPMMIGAVGFQLSVASVLGIMCLSPGITAWLEERRLWADTVAGTVAHKLRRWVSGSVGITLGATLMTAPLTAVHFGSVSLVGILTNLLTLPVVSVTFCAIILCVLFSLVWLPLGGWIAWAVSWPIRYILAVAGLLGAVPCGAVYTQNVYMRWWLILAVAMIGAYLLFRLKKGWLLLCSLVLSLGTAILLARLEPAMCQWQLSALDVGQGQCIVLHADGRTYMIDCGGDHDQAAADTAAEYLLSRGISRLDGLILTHYDRDHSGGAQHLLSRIGVDALYVPDTDEREEWASLQAVQPQAELVLVSEDVLLQWGSSQLTVMAPVYWQTANESSLCILFQREKCDILITGDQPEGGEKLMLLTRTLPDLDILVAGHHGAGSSTSQAFLEHCRPEKVIISVGADNGYGHPDPQVLYRVRQLGCEVYRTDLMGTVEIKE